MQFRKSGWLITLTTLRSRSRYKRAINKSSIPSLLYCGYEVMKCCLATDGLMNYIFVDKNTTKMVTIVQNVQLMSKLGFNIQWTPHFKAVESSNLLYQNKQYRTLKFHINFTCDSCKGCKRSQT